MRFLLALAFATAALGAPNYSGDLDTRGQSIVASISLSLKTVDSSCSSQNSIIRKALLSTLFEQEQLLTSTPAMKKRQSPP